MADWFKFYADFFDHPRFQYAIHQLPEVCPVTVLILTEHCRHRSDTIAWSGDEVDLLGFSAMINVTPGKINEAVRLLERIRFIEITEGFIKFLKWNDLQSEYCRKKQRNKAKVSGHNPDMSGQCPPRGEERRLEEKRESTVAPLPRFQKPSLEAVKLQAVKSGVSESEAEKFFNYYESNGWRVGRNPMKSWTHALTNWKNNATNYGSNNRSAALKPNPRNFGVIVNPATNYATAKPRLQRQREEEARLAREVAANGHNPPATTGGA